MVKINYVDSHGASRSVDAEEGSTVMESAIRVGNLDHRVVVDHAKPDPNGTCVQ